MDCTTLALVHHLPHVVRRRHGLVVHHLQLQLEVPVFPSSHFGTCLLMPASFSLSHPHRIFHSHFLHHTRGAHPALSVRHTATLLVRWDAQKPVSAGRRGFQRCAPAHLGTLIWTTPRRLFALRVTVRLLTSLMADRAAPVSGDKGTVFTARDPLRPC